MARSDDLDWDDLRYFLRATQSKTLSGAARSMGVEHTTIGRRLSALERSLGAPLLLRGPEGLQLTRLGAQAAPLIEEVERAVAAVSGLVASQRAHVRLATPSGFAKLFSESLPLLTKDHPDISLEIVSGAQPVDLMKGEADIAVRSGPVREQDLIVRKLCESGFSLYASNSYLARRPAPAGPNDLSGQEIVGFDPSLSHTPPGRWIEEHAVGAAIMLRSREMTDVLGAALAGVGLAVLPCMLGDQEPSLKRLTPKVLVTNPLSLAYRREARLAEPVRTAIRFVTDVIRRNARLIRGTRRDS